ncbi:MAG: S-methyl-5'-thioadenosine phosphorylase [Verrucomicrobiae bacterium]|nr:S-methyl-5'-thioadenosine phosphorylase [Verrucomicrobiae bacterium]
MIGIIGGSGLYEMSIESASWRRIATPFGAPSDAFFVGRIEGRDVAFLPRHGRGHRLLPSELNHRANLWAFKSLGARFLVSVSAVGSLRAEMRPLDLVLPDQFLDRTKRSLEHTFFGGGIVAHLAFAHPTSDALREILLAAAKRVLGRRGPKVHPKGVYVNMEGPAFSTKAESRMYRKLGGDVIGMTNLGEAKLAREAEIAYASMAMVTDYDCWKEDEAHVSVEMILGRLRCNADAAREIVRAAVSSIPLDACWPEHRALETAILTPRKLWPAATVRKLRPILGRLLGRPHPKGGSRTAASHDGPRWKSARRSAARNQSRSKTRPATPHGGR